MKNLSARTKKYLSVGLVAALVATALLAACSGKSESESEATTTQVTQATQTQTDDASGFEVMAFPDIVPLDESLEPPSETPEEMRAIWEAWRILTKDYYDREKLDPSVLVDGAIRGMIKALDDPHTSYIDPESFALENTDYLGEFQGIGAEVSMRRDGKLVIISPMPGSPAEKSGLRPGDIILEVDGESIEGMSLLEAVARVRGPKGSIVRLLVRHITDIDPILIEVQRGLIPLVSVILRSEPSDKYAHIRLTNYFPDTSKLLGDIIEEAVGQGAEGLIIDVRDNLGGLLSSVVEVTSQFLDDGLVVYEIDGQGRRKNWRVRDGGVAKDIPMVVLVNEFSASASEVFAGALQDHNRATIIGTETFGKAAVNVFRELSNGGGLYVTFAQWFTPAGRRVHGVGLEPDIEVTAADRTDADVKQLEKAFEVLDGLTQAKGSAGASS